MSESNNDSNMLYSWPLALWSVVGLAAPLLARNLSTVGRTVEKAAVSWCKVLMSGVPALPMGKAMDSTRPHYLPRAAKRREYFSVFFSNLMSQPRSMHKPISTMMRVHCFLSTKVVSGEASSGTPLA